MSGKAGADIDVQSRRATAAPGSRSIARTLLTVANLIKRSGNITYKAELGLSSIAWTVIARLGEAGPLTQTELAEMTLFDKGQLSRTAVQLAQAGLILRDSRTWRSLELRLAPAGVQVYEAISRISRARHEALMSGISDLEMGQFFATLDKIDDNARQLLQKL